jgi:hypothetical protein
MGIAKENVTVTAEKLALSRFREKIVEHGISGTVDGGDGVVAEAVSDPEMADVKMTGTGTIRRTAIGSEFNSTLVILVENVVQEGVALSLEKIGGPDGVVKVVGDAENLGFSRAFRVELLARGARDESTGAKSEETASVGAAVGVTAVGPAVSM